MAKFMFFTAPSGDRVGVNMDHVLQMWPMTGGGTTLKLDDGQFVTVVQGYETIAEWLSR